MTAPLPRHFDIAGVDWRDPSRRDWGWRQLLPVLRKRLEECRRRGREGRWGHHSWSLNQQLALAEAVQDGEEALKETANVE